MREREFRFKSENAELLDFEGRAVDCGEEEPAVEGYWLDVSAAITLGLREWGMAGGAWIRGRVVGDVAVLFRSGVRRPTVGSGEVGFVEVCESWEVRGWCGLGVDDRLRLKNE